MRPTLTYSERGRLLRQLCGDGQAWLDRIAKGKPVLISGDGNTLVQALHSDDAASGFVHALGRDRCIGQSYHLVQPEASTWAEHHRTAMRVLGREVELVGLPMDTLARAEVPGKGLCLENLGYHQFFDSSRLQRDVPEFSPRVSLEAGMARVIAAQREAGTIADSDHQPWEDRLVEKQRAIS